MQIEYPILSIDVAEKQDIRKLSFEDLFRQSWKILLHR